MGRKILTDAGYDVVTVNNGSAALKRVAEQKPDLIVLDVYMPGYSGLEVCVRLKEAAETARIPILLTVGKLEPFKPEEATRVRADAFIVKPFEASELLSALTRLEDRMVPSQSDGARFGGSVSSVERFSGESSSKRSSEDDADAGWKNRLRFPSKKKKEEPEPEPEAEPDFVTPTSFREFRRGGKAAAGASPAAQEPTVVPDIPRDITPEELDALSELAAKLDGAPAAENAAPAQEAPAAPAAQPEVRTEVQEMKVEAPPAEFTPPAVAETTVEASAPEEDRTAVAEVPAEMPATPPEETTYQTEPAMAQEIAPVDREDEPTFASAVPVPQAEEVAPQEPVAEPIAASAAEVPAVSDAVSAPVEELKAEEAAPVEQPAAPATMAGQASGETSPSAEELAEALRLLTPAQTSMPGSLAEAGAALAEQLTGTGRRWVAESVAPSAEEASGSLEAEMFRAFSQGGNAPATEAPAEQEAVTVAEAPQAFAAIEESSPTTFADAVRDDTHIEEQRQEPAPVEAIAGVDDAAAAEIIPAIEEAKGKEPRGKRGKSNGRQAAEPVNSAAEAVREAEEKAKAMAAAAAAQGSDPSQIANIVDSVLADLRPKIVEEIAKQLSKK